MATNDVGPCHHCATREWCSAYRLLKNVSSAWKANTVEVDHNFLYVEWADVDETGVLNIRVCCNSFEDDPDA